MSEHSDFPATQPTAGATGRSEWNRPELRKSDAREAENNPTNTTDNAVLS